MPNECECLSPGCTSCEDDMKRLGIPIYPTPELYPFVLVTPKPDHGPVICIYDPRLDKKNICTTCNNVSCHTVECNYQWSRVFEEIIVHANRPYYGEVERQHLCIHSYDLDDD